VSTAQLIEKIERLPPDVKKEAEEFIAARERAIALGEKSPYGLKLGLLKGRKLIMSEDFDAPL
jgi:hypothetical protein